MFMGFHWYMNAQGFPFIHGPGWCQDRIAFQTFIMLAGCMPLQASEPQGVIDPPWRVFQS